MGTIVETNSLVDAAAKLEPLPSSVSRLIELAGYAEIDIVEIVEVISYDPALTVKLLHAANSAASAAVREISTVSDAVLRMGTSTVIALATGSAVAPRMKGAVLDLPPGELWRHSITAALAIDGVKRVSGRPIPPAASTVALLHDIGKLAMAQTLSPTDLERILEVAAEEKLPGHHAELMVLTTNHANLGAVAARSWKLPDIVVEGICNHHSPSEATTPLQHAVLIADCVSYDAHSEKRRGHLADALGSLHALGLDHTDYGDIVAFAKRRHDELGDRFG